MNPETLTLDDAIDLLIGDAILLDDSITLDLDGCTLNLRSNSKPLLQGLSRYFHHCLASEPPLRCDLEVIAIERPQLDADPAYIDWKREPGKKGRKDSYLDFSGGRLVRKVRTGMVFLQSESQRIAAGPCIEYDNQVINFINAQYMNWLQNRGWLICHAAGLVHKGNALGMAGFSGGGKSTLMLHLMEQDGISYLTNDRLFILHDHAGTQARGIPKLPRVNPGTIVHNPRLHSLIPEQQRQSLLELPQQELWELEEKYDVMIDEVYGPNKIHSSAPLKHFLVLNWHRDQTTAPAIDQVDLSERRDLLAAIMKSPGPFYQMSDGHFYQDTMGFDEQAYLDQLESVAIYEVTGGIDFDRLTRQCIDELLI